MKSLSKSASPSELADKFFQQIAVADRDSDRHRLSLVVSFRDICRVEVILRLKVHPDISRNAKGLFQGYCHAE